MARVLKQDEEPEATPVAPAAAPDVFGESAEGTSLTDRQRTKLEKRDSAVVDGRPGKCSNHSDVDSVITVTTDAHEPQYFCDECITRYGISREN